MNEERKPVVSADQQGALVQLVRTIRLVWLLLKDPRVPIWTKVIIPAALVYVLSPIDLLPDFILGLGQIDDIAILFLGIRLFIDLCPYEVVEEHRRSLAGPAVSEKQPADQVVEGSYRVLSDDE
jgi:uncharacterized membrane protein YkvA (DUF1232 family)